MKVVGFARLQTANRISVSSSWEENNIIYHFSAFAGGHFLFLGIRVNTLVFNRNTLSFTFCPLLSSFFPSKGSLVTCEFLLQNGANVNQRDVQGRGPLHHATVLGHTG